MRQSFQLALNFNDSQLDNTTVSEIPPEIPIDKYFPEDEANKLAALESYNKHLYRPNTYLHKWWARRSGTTFRYILKQLVQHSGKRNFYEAGGLESKIIFDPMMGGGTILHESIRMGASVIGIDIDPIPVLQAKASLTQSSLKHKKDIFSWFFTALKDKLTPLYKTLCPICNLESEIQFTLYGLRKRCSCREVIFVDSFLLRQNNHNDVNICSTCHEVYTGETHTCQKQANTPLILKGTRCCEKCSSVFDDILDEPFSKRYIPMVIVGSCTEHGTFFKSVDNDDLVVITQALSQTKHISFGNSQDFRIPRGPKSSDLLRRDINSFQELFTHRQLLYLSVSLHCLSKLSAEDQLWLALLISTSLEFNCLLCGYKGSDIRRPGAIRHVFSHHAYSFPYTALENNPVFSGNTSGTLNRLFNARIQKAWEWAIEPVETMITDGRRTKIKIIGEIDAGEQVNDWKSLIQGKRKFLILQGDSAAGIDLPDGIADYVVTDPPYFDSVQYSDLSNFFRVWLCRLLPHEADWHYNPLGSAVSEGGSSDGHKYGEILGKIWKNCFRVLNKEYGRLIFTFHHWKPEAWAELTLSLKKAKFILVNRYVVFSENPISVHIMGLKSLKHDTVLVLQPNIGEEKPGKWLKPSLIEITDSYRFCHDCGTALGWFLCSDASEEDIRKEWKRLIGGKNNNGKASG
jgi:putative DNA methylase